MGEVPDAGSKRFDRFEVARNIVPKGGNCVDSHDSLEQPFGLGAAVVECNHADEMYKLFCKDRHRSARYSPATWAAMSGSTDLTPPLLRHDSAAFRVELAKKSR